MFFGKPRDEATKLMGWLTDYRRTKSAETLRRIMELLPTVPMFYDSLIAATGADGFPYVDVTLRAKLGNKSSLAELALVAINEGFGVTLNRSATGVDWVFSLGDLVPLFRAGKLVYQAGQTGYRETIVVAKTKVQVGAPSEDIIPSTVRKHLRQYMQTVIGIQKPQFCLMYNTSDNPPWTIIFNFSKQDFGSEQEFQRVLGSLTWFFPKTVYTRFLGSPLHQFYDI